MGSANETVGNRTVTSRDIFRVAERAASKWASLVSCLSPELFSSARLEEIRRTHRIPLSQARAALDAWRAHFDRNATCRALITALCDIGCRPQAVQVFGVELVDAIDRS